MPEYKKFAKVYPYKAEVVITEKIDGVNAALIIEKVDPVPGFTGLYEVDGRVLGSGLGPGESIYTIYAQADGRILSLERDHFGLAAWVRRNAADLIRDLGPGHHSGEWWGRGIKRSYGRTARYFSLFNTERWSKKKFLTPGLTVVPVLARANAEDCVGAKVDLALATLRLTGSHAATGFWNPEGVMVFHTGSETMYKVPIESSTTSPGDIFESFAVTL